MSNDMQPVGLSVIIISVSSGASLEKCLTSISENELPNNIEIIVALGASNKRVTTFWLKSFPKIRFIEFQKTISIQSITAAIIDRSNGEIIALTDQYCVVDKNWVNAIIRSHQSPGVIFGGSVKPLYNQMSLLDFAVYLCEYGQFMPPLNRGRSPVLPGNNFSFKRSALNTGSEFTKPEFWKSFWCEQLRQSGMELILEPEISISYAKNYSFRSMLKRRFSHGRCFAGIRARQIAPSKRLFYLSGSILLPVLFVRRLAKSIFGKNVSSIKLITALPFVLLVILSWSIGKFFGYLAGTGKSCDYID